MPRRARTILITCFLGLTTLLAACGGLADPEGWSGPHFEDDRFYYFPDRDHLIALDFDGTEPTTFAWEFPGDTDDESDIDIEAVYSDLVVTDEAIFFAGWEGAAYALDPDSGDLLWSTQDRIDVRGSVVGGILLHNDKVYFGTTDGGFYALDGATGVTADGWPPEGLEFPKGIWATPVVVGDTIFVATMNGEVHAIDAADGSPVWEEPFETRTGAIPELALIDDVLFVPTLGKRIYLVDPETGVELRDSFATDDWVWTTPAYDDDMALAFFGDFAGNVHALDITTGLDRWRFEGDHKVKAGPVIIGDTLLVADRGPTVHFLDLQTGERRNSVPLSGAGTIRANLVERDGVAFVVTTNGHVYRADPEALTVTRVDMPGAPE